MRYALALIIVVLVLLAGGALRAQEKSSPPTLSSSGVLADVTPVALTDVVQLQILNAAKDLEIAELKREAARVALQTLIAAVTPAGYQIVKVGDKLELAPLPAPPKKDTP